MNEYGPSCSQAWLCILSGISVFIQLVGQINNLFIVVSVVCSCHIWSGVSPELFPRCDIICFTPFLYAEMFFDSIQEVAVEVLCHIRIFLSPTSSAN